MTRKRKRASPLRARAEGKVPPSRRRTLAIAAGVLVAIVLLAVIAIPYRRARGEGRPVDVELPAGATDREVVARLEAAGVVRDPNLFALYLRVRGGARPSPGRHLLADDLSFVEILRRLRRDPSAARVKVTIPEGFDKFEIARRLRERRVCDDRAFLEATTDPGLLAELELEGSSAEGWLFPTTYELPADSDGAEIVRRMVKTGKARLDRLIDAAPEALPRLASLGFGRREVVILASIVEKEAVVDDERPLIASVFLNRLRDPSATGGRLEADPTAAYGCRAGAPTPACAAWLASGSRRPNAAIEHDRENLWSTYTHAGLPPTAIANPGEKSLAAVLAPAPSKYLFFVARGGGRHTFSETRAAHEKATAAMPR
jgi:UPF0755 protein